ncbi:MAG: glutamate--tRNA ligase [Steroidobacteraceae bacterium]
MSVCTRFAPSPTGYLHIGGLRTALFSWLYARRHGGKFILRIEDTDVERSTADAIQQILDGLEWAGLEHDEGPFYQTERFDRYQEVAEGLLAEASAYYCYCTKEELAQLRSDQSLRGEKPRYDGRCRERTQARAGIAPVVRFKNPICGDVTVDDLVHGRVVFKNSELDDLIIVRSDGTPTYNFCVVVDDMDMKITHVIRGDDHLNNTPRQMNMLFALGCKPPLYAHLPMILGADGAKLSKRHGAVSVLQYRDEGFLPVAVLNYLVRLGWSHGDQEVFSIDEMVRLFDLAAVNKSPAAFNQDKLTWLNQQHMKTAPVDSMLEPLRWHLSRAGVEAQEDDKLREIVVAQRERVKTLKEMASASVFFYRAPETYDTKAMQKHVSPEVLPLVQEVLSNLRPLENWDAPAIHALITSFAATKGISLAKLAQPIRLAICGGAVSPPLDVTLAILGRYEVLSRLEAACVRWGEHRRSAS